MVWQYSISKIVVGKVKKEAKKLYLGSRHDASQVPIAIAIAVSEGVVVVVDALR